VTFREIDSGGETPNGSYRDKSSPQ